ncbi:uncharacterized protein yc1106_09314 [Curvularia clavata]|uniref:Uncharacterized protein n=1 Tax=Curvularia clavata TaxID=95742 RepID=A0A9Q8ZHZ1_CURCL|nr:uncharacterized protein yc1106_09314 [Curvularia clavata]
MAIQIIFSELPTFAKMHVSNIDVETLDLYNIPWKYDTNPEYVVLLREMPQHEMDVLFEHTRRLRSVRGRRRSIEPERRDRRGDEDVNESDDDEETYMRRWRRPASPSPPPPRHVRERPRSSSPSPSPPRHVRGRPRSSSPSPSPPRHQRGDPTDATPEIRTVTFDIASPVTSITRRESDLSSSEDSSDSLTSTSDSIEIIRVDPYEPPREVVAPIDAEGNQLSFQVNTKHVQNLIEFSKGSRDQNMDQETPSIKKDVGNFQTQTFRITRAMIDEADGRSQIQIHVLPGPENPHLQSAVASTWYHISASELDFTHFRDVCLTMPHLSDRLRKLTSEMLKKVYTEKAKPFDGGMFIEPGTVLRADESDQPDPQSVIFSCVPYFSLQPPPKKSSRNESSLFPQRTLMQTFYPYEPVRERDQEQSYRRFSEDRANNIIQVPNLWMMNIGSTYVVTCGHMLLTKEMTNSMTIIEEDIKQLNTRQVAENDLTKIRFTDWGGRDFIFALSACRSYFQMEAKAREIGYMVNTRNYNAKIRLQYRAQEGSFKITPRKWRNVVTRTDQISINVVSVNDDEIDQHSPAEPGYYTTTTLIHVPPFFHWPQQIAKDIDKEHTSATVPAPSSAPQPSDCLEQVEKALTTETLQGSMINAVDATFTSTDHYKSLPKVTYSDAHAAFDRLRSQCESVKKGASGPTFHQITIDRQRAGILEKSIEFFDTTRLICNLFVSDTDESDIISRIWGVMVKIREWVARLESYRPSDQPSDRDTASGEDDTWLVRPTASPCLVSHPEGSPEFIKSIGRCKRCRKFRSFDSQEEALQHLQRHIKPKSEPQKLQKADQKDRLASDESSTTNVPLNAQTKAWVIRATEFWHEQTNAGVLEILTKASLLARHIFDQAEELRDGVTNEDGQMSELYTLPKELPGTFRAIIVFFMATERALQEAVMARGQYHRLKNTYAPEALPYSKRGLEVFEKFKGDAIRSLMIARAQLCYMARSDPPIDVTKYLSRGPEYIGGWLMRRLLLKPLQKRATIGDLYRDYISRLQFQVNHRPSKRLLRDLNLLQEELSILTSVNTRQANLVRNYLTVLDDATYEKRIPSRQSMFPYERILLGACLENLELVMEDYEDLIRRCGPLANRTKQSLEINEEDHGKAIMVFTVVTVIFLPLSFATSYLGMNTADIRDMDQKQGLFWTIAIPLTVVTVGACLLIGYNGEEIRDMFMWMYHKATGKQEANIGGTGISVPRRKRPLSTLGNSSSTTLESSTFASETEVIRPRPLFEYGTVPYTTGWLPADDPWYTAHYEPTVRRSAESGIRKAKSEIYEDHLSAPPAASYRVQTQRTRVPIYVHNTEMDHEYVDDRHRRSGYNHYSERPVPVGYQYNEYSGLDPATPRRSYVSSRPSRPSQPEVPIRQPSARAYELDNDDDSEAYGYTWGKKKERSRSGRHRRADFFER